MTGWHPITLRYLLAIERLNKRTARAEARAICLEEECAALTAEVCRLAEGNAALRARVAVLADLADPKARSMAASVLKTIEEL